MVEHTVKLDGPLVTGGRRDPAAVGHVLTWFPPVFRGTVSMAFRFRSQPRGRNPKWLKVASELRLADISNGDGGTKLHFESPCFGEVAEDLYKQPVFDFVQRPAEDSTGFELIASLLADIKGEVRDSSRFDQDLLKQFGHFQSAERNWGIGRLSLAGGSLPVIELVTITSDVGTKARSLFQETPPPRRVRVMGRLDMIRASDGGFALCLEAGDRVFGVWEPASTDTLNRLWNQDVVVEGDAVFRASGKLLRLDARAMAPATESDTFFATIPRPVLGRIVLDSIRERQTQRTGLSAVFGHWPGDESEEELLLALGEMS